jgi:hypothetical protein
MVQNNRTIVDINVRPTRRALLMIIRPILSAFCAKADDMWKVRGRSRHSDPEQALDAAIGL